MKIGLIIPFKNAEKWLPRCLDSIGGQPFEVYLVNDHSTDKSHVMMIEYALTFDNVWTVWMDPDVTGVSAARNEGLEQALEDGCNYITFLDADDELTEDAFKIYERAIAAQPDAQIIQFNHWRHYADNNRQCRWFNQAGVYTLENLPQFWVVVWSKIYKADLVKNIRFDTNLRHGEDELFVLECLAKARQISCFNEKNVIHHFDNSESLSKLAIVDDYLDEQIALMRFLREHSGDIAMLRAVRNRLAELWSNPNYKRVFGGEP